MSGPQAPILRRLSELRGPDAAGGADPLLRRLVSSFLDRTPGELDGLTGAIQRGDPVAAAAGAHRLHGSAANLGADLLAARCAQLDAAARAGRLDQAGALLPPVRTAFAEVERVLRDLLAAWPPEARA